MNDKCRTLCQRYTELEEEEINVIIGYLDKLQDIADREQSNVYIDCLTYNQQSAVIVAEALPQNGTMIYRKSLLSMVIKTYNEPAVERGFRQGVPTTGVVAIEMPTAHKIVQSVFPIMHNSKVIAILVYEKLLEHYLPRNQSKEISGVLNPAVEWMITHISEAVLIVDADGCIGYCNVEAEDLFRSLGYADSILGMKSGNLIAVGDTDKYQFKMSGRTLEAVKFSLEQGSEKICIIIKDLTELAEVKRLVNNLSIEHRELVHSMKNGLFLLKSVCDRKAELVADEMLSQVYHGVSNRVMSLMMTMEFKMKAGKRNTDIKQVLGELGERLISLEAGAGKDIRLKLGGDELLLNSEETNAVVLVVYELICNALKYAFVNKNQGCIGIDIWKEDFVSWITVSDDGGGFQLSEVGEGSDGLALIRSIVRDRLNGELTITSSKNGTMISFDII